MAGLATGINLVLDVGLVVGLAAIPLDGSTVGIVAGMAAGREVGRTGGRPVSLWSTCCLADCWRTVVGEGRWYLGWPWRMVP